MYYYNIVGIRHKTKGKGNDSNGQFLEVYNPDPNYRERNPMKMNKQLTYTAPGEKTKVVSRYAIIIPVIPEEAPKEENKS